MRLSRLVPFLFSLPLLCGCGMDFCIAGIGPCKFDGIASAPTGSITVSSTSTSGLILVGGTSTITASAGTPNYTFSVVSGGGTLNPLTAPSTSTFTAGNTESCTIIQARDSAGLTGQVALLTQPTVTTGLTLRLSAARVTVNGTVSLEASGGSGAFTFQSKNTVGSITQTAGAATATYTAPTVAGCAIIRVVDNATATNSAELPLLITAQ